MHRMQPIDLGAGVSCGLRISQVSCFTEVIEAEGMSTDLRGTSCSTPVDIPVDDL